VARALLILPSATYRAPDFMAAAKRLGVEVVVGSERRQAMSRALGDRAVVLDLRRPERAAEQIAALHERAPLDAIVAADDEGVRAAALASERLGLPGNPPEAAAAARDKLAMRKALRAAGVPQPEFHAAGPDDDVGALAAELGPPCVIKPLGLSASRGVIRADDPAAARAAAERTRAIGEEAGQDAAQPLLVERFVPGREVAVEGLMRDGRLEVLAVFDKPDPLDGPYFEETIYVTPSRLPVATLEGVEAVCAGAAAALGLREGPVHAELRVGRDELSVLELAARSIGGLCSRTLRFGLGASLEELILRHALGRPLHDTARQAGASGVMMLPIPRAGTLRAVGGQDAARAVRGVAGLEITVAPGRPVRPLPEGDRYLGFLFATGPGPAEVEATLREAHGLLEIEIEGENAAVEPRATLTAAGA